MAVRDDFSAGEVLAAADLNDTFAEKLPYSYGTATPSTSDDGFLWYDSNSTPPEVKFWDGAAFQAIGGGLTLISSEAITSTSSISVNNCFTSDFRNYRIVLKTNLASANFVRARLRSSGTNETGSVYTRQVLLGASTSTTAATGTETSLEIFAGSAATNYVFGIDIFDPQINANTYSISQFSNDLPGVGFSGVIVGTSTQYDGITIYAGATMSGTLRIYGYKD